MMKKILLSFWLLASVITGFSQKTINDPMAEKRAVANFHGIQVSGGIDLYLTQGEEALAVSASETRYRDRIKTEVVNGILKIWYEYDRGLKISWTNGKMRLKAYVSCKDIDKLYASGGSDVILEGTLKGDNLELGVSGGSDLTGRVNFSNLKARASGGSDIHLSGTATTLDVSASGGSDFEGYELTVENCTADASGGSDLTITATRELSVESSGGSDIHYKGGAVIRNIRTSGGGSVKKAS